MLRRVSAGRPSRVERSRSSVPKLSGVLDFLNRLDARFGFGLSPRGQWPLKWDRRPGPNRLERWLAKHALVAAVGWFVLGGAASCILAFAARERFTWSTVGGLALGSLAIYAFGRQVTRQMDAWTRQQHQGGRPKPSRGQ